MIKLNRTTYCLFFILSSIVTYSQKEVTDNTVSKDFLATEDAVVSIENFNGNITNLSYDMDFIYDKNIYFSYSLEQGKYRALYILKPKQYKMWDLNNQIEANATPFLIVGIQLNKPGYKIIKMPFVTFVEP